MTKAKHTPGPWKTRKGFSDGAVEVFSPNTAIKKPAYPTELATVEAEDAEGRANARLIAQAPKLLEDLIYLRDCAESGELPSPERWAQVQAVIKQATGKTP